jgi:hypothetical protein
MDPTSRAAMIEKVRAYCHKPSPTVLFDEAGDLLMDVASGKTLPFDVANLRHLEEKMNAQTNQHYLLLLYGGGRVIALTEVGVAFSPDFKNTGELADLPAAVCFRDYQAMVDRLKHQLYGHPDEEPTKDTVKLLMMCLAIVDGARAQNFDVSREERELEWHLSEIERRTSNKAADAPAPEAPKTDKA